MRLDYVQEALARFVLNANMLTVVMYLNDSACNAFTTFTFT